MFTNTSMTGTGLIVLLITVLLNMFGIVPEENQVATIVGNIAVLVGWALTIWGQLRRGDLMWGFMRKKLPSQD